MLTIGLVTRRRITAATRVRRDARQPVRRDRSKRPTPRRHRRRRDHDDRRRCRHDHDGAARGHHDDHGGLIVHACSRPRRRVRHPPASAHARRAQADAAGGARADDRARGRRAGPLRRRPRRSCRSATGPTCSPTPTPTATVRRRPAALRGRARAARHGRGHPLRGAPCRHRRHVRRRQRRRHHRLRRALTGRVPSSSAAPRAPSTSRRSTIPRATAWCRPTTTGRVLGLHREAAARRGADQLDQRRHLRARAVGHRPHPRRAQGVGRARDVPGHGRRRHASTPMQDGCYWVDAGTLATYLDVQLDLLDGRRGGHRGRGRTPTADGASHRRGRSQRHRSRRRRSGPAPSSSAPPSLPGARIEPGAPRRGIDRRRPRALIGAGREARRTSPSSGTIVSGPRRRHARRRSRVPEASRHDRAGHRRCRLHRVDARRSLVAAGHEVHVVDDFTQRDRRANLEAAHAAPATGSSVHDIDIRDPPVAELIAGLRTRGRLPPRGADRRPRVGGRSRTRRRRSTSSARCTCSKGPARAAPARSCSRRAAARSTASRTRRCCRSTSRYPQHPVSPYGVAKKVVSDYLLRVPAAPRARLHVTRARQRLRPAAGPARRSRRGRDLRRVAARPEAVPHLRLRASRRATSCTSTTSPTRSSGGRSRHAPRRWWSTSARASRRRCSSSTRPWPRRPASTARRCTSPPAPASSRAPRSPPAEPSRRSAGSPGPTSPPEPSPPSTGSAPAGRKPERQRKRSSCGARTSLVAHAAASQPRGVHAPHDGGTDARGLAHDELGRAGDLVDDRDDGDLELVAVGVGGAPKVEDRADARTAEGDVGETATPRPAERVGHDDRDVDAGARPDAVAQAAGRSIGVVGKEHDPAVLDVRPVDAGVGADEAVLRLADDELAAPAQHSHRLALDERLVAERIAMRRRLRACPRLWQRPLTRRRPRRRRAARDMRSASMPARSSPGCTTGMPSMPNSSRRLIRNLRSGRPRRRERATAARSGDFMIVSVTTHRSPRASTGVRVLGVDLVDDEHRREIDGRGERRRRTLDSCPSSTSMRSAGPFNAAPPTIGDTATVWARRAAIASRTPGTASTGAIETSGFDGAITTVAASVMASRTPGPGVASSAPTKRTACTGTPWRCLTKYSWKLISSPVVGEGHARLDAIVGDRQDAELEAPRRG